MSEHEESETGSACSYELLPIEQQNHAHEARATWTNDSNTSPGHDATVCPTKFEHNNLNLSNVDGVDTQLDENFQNFVRQSALTSTELQQLLGAEAPGKHVVYLTRILTKIRTAWAMKWAESKLACIVSIALVCAFFAAVIFTMVRVSHAYQTQEFALRSAIVPSTTVEFPQIVLYFLNQSSSMVINSTRAMYVQGGISLPTKPDWNYDCEKVDDAQPAVRPVFANPNGINMMHYAFNTKGLCMSDRSIRNQRYQIQYASFERAHLEQVSVIAWIGYVDSSNYDSGKPPSSKFVSDVFQESAANGAQVYFNFMQKVKIQLYYSEYLDLSNKLSRRVQANIVGQTTTTPGISMGSAEFFMPSYEITRVSEYIQYDLSYFITVLGSLNGVFSGGFALTWWFLGYSALQTLRTHLKLLDEAEHQPDKH